jgi:proline iminopeptidase
MSSNSPLYPPQDPFATGWLELGDGHRMYYEQSGRAEGLPVVFLHGGPGGGGCSPRHRQLFDPGSHHVVLFDQRGCGRSVPRGAVQHNSSDRLLDDIEALRKKLGISRWLVFGGSWGAGLALAYAAAHPAACLGLVLRGVFLGRPSDLHWFFRQAAQLLPDAWAALASHAPPSVRDDLLPWLYDGLHHAADPEALRRARAWQAWEASVSERRNVAPAPEPLSENAAAALLDQYRVQSHYLVHGCFWGEGGLLSRVGALAQVPTAILHGRLDWICRPQSAWDLHQQIPNSRLLWLDDCGHSPFEPAMAQALIHALKHHADHGDFRSWGSSLPLP